MNLNEKINDTFCNCNVTLTVQLKQEARKYHINISALLRKSLEQEIIQRKRIKAALDNNNAALDYNKVTIDNTDNDDNTNNDNDGGVTNV